MDDKGTDFSWLIAWLDVTSLQGPDTYVFAFHLHMDNNQDRRKRKQTVYSLLDSFGATAECPI
ncbi:MAG: hypothetical protein AAF438_07310 [Pseudomonadota bacterium]